MHMRFLYLICWLRGYHLSSFVVKAATPREESISLNVYGETLPCRVCGRLPVEGRVPDSSHAIFWKLQ